MAINKAFARVTGGASAAATVGKNIASVTHNGTGDDTVTFTQDFVNNNTNFVAFGLPYNVDTNQDHIDVVQVNDTSVRVRCARAGVAANVNYSLYAIAHNAGNP